MLAFFLLACSTSTKDPGADPTPVEDADTAPADTAAADTDTGAPPDSGDPGDTAPADTGSQVVDTGGEGVDTAFDCGADGWVDTGLASPATPLPTSPDPQILVVTANLYEAFDQADVDDGADVKVFAERIAGELPYAPDVVLLQEVVAESAERAASKLEQQTGHPYVVAIGPEETTTVETGDDYKKVRDTAILYNDTTMKVATHDGAADEGGYISSWYSAEEGLETEKRHIKQQAYIYLKKDGVEGTRFGFVSVHFATSDRLASDEVALEKKGEWSADLVTEIEGRYTYADGFVIGGDFNNKRCEVQPERVACDETPFWTVLTGAYEYVDAVFSLYGTSDASLWSQYRKGDQCGSKRIDYLFAAGAVLEGGHDVNYAAEEGDPDFYSDHRFVWALVEADPAR